jgi:GDP-L-fucose synthase
MVGSATHILLQQGFTNLFVATSKELNLINQPAVERFFEKEKPEVVILCAAKLGGIQTNIENLATFLLDNLQMQNNVMAALMPFLHGPPQNSPTPR